MMNQAISPHADSDLSMILPALFEDFVHFQNLKDMSGIQSCLHDESPGAAAMAQNFEALFDHFTLHVCVLASHYGGWDGDYAYCRFIQKLEKITGPEFNEGKVDNLIIFRQQGKDWKIWNCLPLSMEATKNDAT